VPCAGSPPSAATHNTTTPFTKLLKYQENVQDNKQTPVRYINYLLLSDTQESTQDNKQDVAISHSLRYNKIGILNWEACYENVFSAVFHNK
jgi:hypothetical protein